VRTRVVELLAIGRNVLVSMRERPAKALELQGTQSVDAGGLDRVEGERLLMETIKPWRRRRTADGDSTDRPLMVAGLLGSSAIRRPD
jgi:hypothetical protein